VRGITKSAVRTPNVTDLEHYKRLVALQQEIVAVARRNNEVEEECLALRKQLAREARRRRRQSSGLWRGVHAAAREILQRLTRSNGKGAGPTWSLQPPPPNLTTA
jgi:hypothetical protein